MLGDVAGLDHAQDNALRGRIAATKALLHIEYSDIYGEREND